jgi:hypothetical protein
MKKTLIFITLILILSMLVVGPVAAQKGKINIKGEVTTVGAGTLTIQTHKGETFVVTVPDGFDLNSIQVGDSVLVKAIAGEGGAWQAQSVKLVGKGSDGNAGDGNELENEGQAEGSKDNGAFCVDGKQEKPHPLAVKIADRYGVTEQWVMDYFCEGYGMGAIMLALKTSEMDGVTVDPDALLAKRANGQGWGLIWQEIGLIGSEKNGHSPPGLLKKPDHAGPKNK